MTYDCEINNLFSVNFRNWVNLRTAYPLIPVLEKRKKIIVSVSNDLATDQRVKKVCAWLHAHNFEVVLLGRRLRHSLEVTDRPYKVKRFKLWFNKGALFYANLNIRLYFYLLFHKSDWLLSNDLDTLPANYYARKKRVLVYDTHELFCEVPELQHNLRKKKIWLGFEKRIFPKLKKVITVNQSIANWYENLYKVKPVVLRNISERRNDLPKKSRSELGLPSNKFIGIIQGSGINVNRGNEEAVHAFELLGNDYLLLIIGSGDVVEALQKHVAVKQVGNVVFKPRMPHAELMHYTANSDFGISLDKDTNLNYKFSLPNKLFDFMHAGIPVLASNLPEIARVVNNYGTGIIIDSYDLAQIAEKITELKNNKELQQKLKANCLKASEVLNWENECKVLEQIYGNQ
jgi:glycosyltransferase involved in cell wall biosynthesis